jgi:hypothetical protein
MEGLWTPKRGFFIFWRSKLEEENGWNMKASNVRNEEEEEVIDEEEDGGG